jgi:hypothetical protein
MHEKHDRAALRMIDEPTVELSAIGRREYRVLKAEVRGRRPIADIGPRGLINERSLVPGQRRQRATGARQAQ